MAFNTDRLMRNPFFRTGAAILSIGAVAGAAAALWLAGRAALFEGNRHFCLAKVVVKSHGFLGNKPDPIVKILDLKYGVTNIVGLDLSALRARLKEHIASIDSVEVRRILPDTLVFDIVERLPRAVLGDRNSKYIVDAKGTIVPRSLFGRMASDLPFISGYAKPIRSGEKPPELEPVMELLYILATDHRDIRVYGVHLHFREKADRLPSRLTLMIVGPERRVVKVFLPCSSFGLNLRRLEGILQRLAKERRACNEISLLYEDQVVVN